MTTTIMLLQKECPFCEYTYSTFQNGRRHVFNKHSKNVQPRKRNDQMKRNNKTFIYNTLNAAKYPDALVKHCCISCISTFETKDNYSKHVNDEHITRDQVLEPRQNDRWMLHGQDISEKFYEYRTQCLACNFHDMVSHFNEILSLSGIIVLQQRAEYGSLPYSLFSPYLLKAMRQYQLTTLYNCPPFNTDIFLAVNIILNDYVKDNLNDDHAKIRLLQLCEELREEERCVIQAIVGLIPSMYDCNMKSLSEYHLSSSFIHPFLQGLFSSKSPTKVPHCSNIMTDEQDGNKKRPDYIVDIYENYEFAYTTVYGEIKPSKDIPAIEKVVDFHRIAIFCKDAMDKYNLSTTIGIQVVGKTMTFFSMTLQYEHLYTFTEIANVEIPLKKSDLLNLVGRFDDLAMVSYVHNNLCSPSNHDISLLRTKTSQFSYLYNSIGQSNNKKRKLALSIGSS